MPIPKLPVPAPGEMLLVCTSYEEDTGTAEWGEVLRDIGGRPDGGAIVLDDGGVRLRPTEHPRWDYLQGGHFPALVQEASPAPPIALLADIAAVYGGGTVLLLDLRDVPGRGVRVLTDGLGRLLAQLLGGSLRFDELVRGMDRFGIYQGDSGAPAVPTPTEVVRTAFPRLPGIEGTLLVRTDFTDDVGWQALRKALGEPAEDVELSTGHELYEETELHALVVNDRRFEHLQPGQVPALVPPHEHTTMVALANAASMADPSHPLLVVDLYDTPGQVARVPLAEAGSMAVNLQIANTDFGDWV
jgi:hypothetical protein